MARPMVVFGLIPLVIGCGPSMSYNRKGTAEDIARFCARVEGDYRDDSERPVGRSLWHVVESNCDTSYETRSLTIHIACENDTLVLTRQGEVTTQRVRGFEADGKFIDFVRVRACGYRYGLWGLRSTRLRFGVSGDRDLTIERRIGGFGIFLVLPLMAADSASKTVFRRVADRRKTAQGRDEDSIGSSRDSSETESSPPTHTTEPAGSGDCARPRPPGLSTEAGEANLDHMLRHRWPGALLI